jgi:hypothetical protein
MAALFSIFEYYEEYFIRATLLHKKPALRGWLGRILNIHVID